MMNKAIAATGVVIQKNINWVQRLKKTPSRRAYDFSLDLDYSAYVYLPLIFTIETSVIGATLIFETIKKSTLIIKVRKN